MGTTEPGSAAERDPPQPAEDVRDYLQRLRTLPVEQVIGDVMFTMLNAAQAKLGRRDARLLIDVSSVAHQHARPHLPDPLARQIEQVLAELRMSQVTAEGRSSQQGEREENDLDVVPAPPQPHPQPPG